MTVLLEAYLDESPQVYRGVKRFLGVYAACVLTDHGRSKAHSQEWLCYWSDAVVALNLG
jgi:hypothetical protein